MKRKINNDTANESSKRAEDIIDEQTSESSALNSSIDANSSQDQSSSLKEEGSSRRKRGRPKRTDAVTLPSTSESITQSSTAVENEKQALEETTIDVDSENVINTDGNDSTMTNCESTDPQTQPNRSADADPSIAPVPSTNRRSKRRVRSTVVVEDREPEQEELKTNMVNGSVNNTNASNASSSDSGPTESPTAPLTSRNARPKRKKVSNEKDSSMFELVCTKVVDDEEDAETDIVVDDDMDDIVLRSPCSKGKNGTSRSETSVVVVEPLRDALINSVKLTEDDLIKNDGSVEDFTQKTKFRTAQIIVCGRILYVNPFALIEYSDIVANVFEQSGRNCKIQLDFLDFDELQTALRIFCRSPVTGLKERLNDPNSVVSRKKCCALISCSVFISVLRSIVECDDIPDMVVRKGQQISETITYWYKPDKYRTFEVITLDTKSVYVNIEMIKEYSSVLSHSPAVSTDYCMLPQFTSSELITALNVLFRNPRTGRFHSVTLENLETLYKCAGLFECLRPMCDAFSKDVSIDAVIKADWQRLKSILQVQANRRKCGEPNRMILVDILNTTAGLLRNSAYILERLQRAGIPDVPMGIGIALMVAITEARAKSVHSEAMNLIL